jgi:hypothetical protein
MRKITTVDASINNIQITHSGTELVNLDKLFDLTEGKPIDISFKSDDGVEGVISLIYNPNAKSMAHHETLYNRLILIGNVMFKTVEREDP